MKTLATVIAAVAIVTAAARAELIMHENFSVTEGSVDGDVFQLKQASGNVWVSGYTQAQQPLYYAGDLSYAGLEASSGNAKINLNNFTAIERGRISKSSGKTSGPLYVSFLLRVTSTSGLLTSFSGADGGNGRMISVRSTDGSNVLGLIDDGAGGFKLAIDNRQTSGSPTYTGSLSLNTTYLVVFGNTDDIAVDNSTMSLWVNPTPGGAQGAATITDTWRAENGTAILYLANDSITANGGTLASVYMDEMRLGTTWADVTPAAAGGAETNYVADVTVPDTVDVASADDLTVITNLISGSGVLAKTGEGTLHVIGSVAPGSSPGTITFSKDGGALEFGTASDTVQLLIENGDLVVVSNLAAALNLGNVDVKYIGVTTLGETNWFLYSTSGINGTFNNIDYSSYSGETMYDGANNRVGAVVVPEPAALCVMTVVLLTLTRRRD